jgi:hypothetical protein
VRSALRWIRRLFLGDVAIVAAWIIALTLFRVFGADVQQLKWPTVFYCGIMIIIAAFLGVVALTLQIIIAVQRRLEAR